jgi:hypothetical protein
MSQAALSQELQAGVDEFLRRGGTITQLNWAGVPIDGTPVEPKPVRSYGREYERVAAEKALKAKAAPAPAVVIPEPVVTRRVDPQPEPAPCIIAELRSIRAEARRLIAHVDTLAAAMQRDSDTESGFHSSQTQ